VTENFESNYADYISPNFQNVEVVPKDTLEYIGTFLDGAGIDFSLTGNPYTTSSDNVALNPPISKNHLWKYNEGQILKDVSEYVTSTYGSHYCGQNQEYRNIQTIDLMAAKDLAQDFCQANILKYGSRYGAKNGRNKIDLLKVIHYAMLLLHFDGHYTRKDNGLSEFK
jgi:hypothetical protein